MVFDIRGRRKIAVKVVYAVLAVLMGASLFLVVGPVNLGELFNGESGSGEAAKQFEEQAERIEVKLKKEPENPDLLLALTRSQVNAGDSSVEVAPNGEQAVTAEAVQQYQRASESWSKYLEAAGEPSSGVAQLMANTLFRLAESSRSLPEAENNIHAAAEAQQIVSEKLPTLNSLSTLAIYRIYGFEFGKAKQLEAEALKLAKTKSEKETLEKQLKETEKRAHALQQAIKKEEKAKKAGQGAAPSPESLGGQSPFGGALSGGLGG